MSARKDPKTGLTEKQEAFCRAVVSGSTASDAYRSAYNAGRMTDKQIWEESCKLAATPKVSQRLSELREAVTEKTILTRAWVIEKLMKNAEDAMAEGDKKAANRALELLGKVDTIGLFVERSESDNRHHHTAGPVSAFDGWLEETVGERAEAEAKKSLPN